MFDPNFPILDFYPLEFEQDLNGKKQDWEAVVKFLFIDGYARCFPWCRRTCWFPVSLDSSPHSVIGPPRCQSSWFREPEKIDVHFDNAHENRKVEDIAQEMIGGRTFIGWPFLQEGKVVAVSDSLFKYEKVSLVQGDPPKIISNPHTPQALGLWKMKAERIEHFYSKRCGVITGSVDVLLHVRPLKGESMFRPFSSS